MRLVWDFDFLHFAKYISISPHGIDVNRLDVRGFITWIEPADWIPCGEVRRMIEYPITACKLMQTHVKLTGL